MSRSYKKQPFMAVTGTHSAKQDKIYAHRGARRAQDKALSRALLEDELEDLLIPHFRECPSNNVYGWSRDGKQRYQGKWKSPRSWSYFYWDEDGWPSESHRAMMRK